MNKGLIALGFYLFIGLILYLSFVEETDFYELIIIPFWPLLLIVWLLIRNDKSNETDCGCS